MDGQLVGSLSRNEESSRKAQGKTPRLLVTMAICAGNEELWKALCK